ncbi:S8 family serine peptidase [Actinokineospora iranica]|uniref:S8 family serine peptidase n=1 Tax=Actinokineospora iranica TaxID=1271860 RepID=UPI000B81F2AA|nr:S8 family serine peptidase [Actinokineospora iranica]
MPQDLLDRHGGRVLDPERAEVAAGWPRPRPTAYRRRVLLIPNDILGDDTRVEAINEVMGASGLAPIDAAADRRVARPVVLRPSGDGDPDDVDSWAVLQRLRTAADRDDCVLDRDAVERISLDHLMFSAVTITGTPWDTNGEVVDGSYRRSTRGASRVPVALALEPPDRGKVGTDRLTRRPVIAVLDSGIGPHPWFGIPDRATPPPREGFLSVLDEAQEAIRQNAVPGSPSLLDYWDAPAESDTLIRDIDSNIGHGTFIAGIVRQVAPKADVLAVRVMHSDGIAHGSDVLAALWEISRRVERAQNPALGRQDEMVDIVSLSLGYLDETPADAKYTTHVAEVVNRLTEQGVLVVAAAGNQSTSRRYYPAALAETPEQPGAGPQVISVGALNPNATKTVFSNDGDWVTCWATGAGVVSTFPTDVSGPRQPDFADEHRCGLDPDDFSSGFAVWDGTSFAAPMAAAALANALIEVGACDTGLGLANVDPDTVVKRAWAALERCYEQHAA